MANVLKQTIEESIQNTSRRDFLIANERKQQERWENGKVFEADADPNKEKYFVTFPYPYMNGQLHLGHLFTISKADFSAYYQRMKGKNTIFPFGFHVTGMPIKACADKLKRELEQYGEQGPAYPSEEELEKMKSEMKKDLGGGNKQQHKKVQEGNQHHSNKSKATSKQGEGKLQWEIMRSLGMKDELICKFTDCNFWLKYFPEICKSNLKSMGVGIDWRRSFYTTEANKYYDQFVRWQFIKLKEKNKIEFGKRYSIYSPKDGQPCMDHDRASGETVLPIEYTLIKLELLKEYPEIIKNFFKQENNNYLEKKNIYFVAATLRVETMYGQVNCWIKPEGEYGLFEINENEMFICTERSANNLSYQNYSITANQRVKALITMKGKELIGSKLKAPLCKYEYIYALPMKSINMEKGTGIVTSVPSDSPDDYQTWMELRNFPIWREKLSVKDEWVLGEYEIVPVIETEKGKYTAEQVCFELNIQSSKEKEKLKKAKEISYKLGYYEGRMITGEWKGEKVMDVKEKIKEKLIENEKYAIKYAEPESEVISRSGDVCVVALTDQWFINYADNSWKENVRKALEKLNTFGEESRNTYEHTLEWLKQWACSRNYGLGTRLPWDEEYLIESLSDSTIYMAYYTISHLLQSGVYDGSSTGRFNILPEQLTPSVFDFIFLKNSSYPENSTIPKHALISLKNEFQYWYPLDLRVSGKDLIPNHLTFSLYNHVAIWENEPDKWPLAFRGNGHLLLNNSKMSKQSGNFLSVSDAIDLFGADATRMALAHAGDTISDANFESSNANKAVLDLYNAYQWAKQILQPHQSSSSSSSSCNTNQDPSSPSSLPLLDSELDYHREIDDILEDRIFLTTLNYIIQQTDNAYSKLHFREALLYAFYELKTARDNYRSLLSPLKKMNGKLIVKFIQLQALLMVPITPHWSELIWELLGNRSFIIHQSFPTATTPIDHSLLSQQEYIFRIRDEFTKKLAAQKKRNISISHAVIYVTDHFPVWHEHLIAVLNEYLNSNTSNDHEQSINIDHVITILKNHQILKSHLNLAVPLLKELHCEIEKYGKSAITTFTSTPFDEKQLLLEILPFLQHCLGIPLHVKGTDTTKNSKSSPLRPAISFIPLN